MEIGFESFYVWILDEYFESLIDWYEWCWNSMIRVWWIYLSTYLICKYYNWIKYWGLSCKSPRQAPKVKLNKITRDSENLEEPQIFIL